MVSKEKKGYKLVTFQVIELFFGKVKTHKLMKWLSLNIISFIDGVCQYGITLLCKFNC